MIRPWADGDEGLLKAAIDASLAELREWMPWARDEPSSLETLAARIRTFGDAFAAGTDWIFGILDPTESEALGGCGLHPRVGPGGLEIGYWIRTGMTGRGYATAAAAALTDAAFRLPWVEFVEIRCDARNLRSARIPARLGYEQVETVPGSPGAAGEAGETMVWRVRRSASALGS